MFVHFVSIPKDSELAGGEEDRGSDEETEELADEEATAVVWTLWMNYIKKISILLYSAIDKIIDRIVESFLLLLCVLLSFTGWSLVCSLLLSCLPLRLQSCLLLLHYLLILLHRLRVHLNCCVAEPTVVAVPVLAHAGSGTTGGAGFPLLGDVSLSWVNKRITIDAVEGESEIFDLFVDVFVFLFGGVDFLLFLPFAAL